MGRAEQAGGFTDEIVPASPERFVEQRGTYLGFTPTDESAVEFGELEAVIDETTIKLRYATGLEVTEEEVIGLDELVPLTEQELSDWLAPVEPNPAGEEAYDDEDDNPALGPDDLRGYKLGQTALFLFRKDDSGDTPAVTIFSGGMSDLLGPSMLFTPDQVERGLHAKTIADIESEYGQTGVIPRLDGNDMYDRSED